MVSGAVGFGGSYVIIGDGLIKTITKTIIISGAENSLYGEFNLNESLVSGVGAGVSRIMGDNLRNLTENKETLISGLEAIVESLHEIIYKLNSLKE